MTDHRSCVMPDSMVLLIWHKGHVSVELLPRYRKVFLVPLKGPALNSSFIQASIELQSIFEIEEYIRGNII